MGKDVIIACDFPGGRECLEFLDKFKGRRPYIKIGMELYYATGPDFVRELKSRGYSIFLDLKLHDIPNTVRRASTVLGRLGVDMLNVHAAGGAAMMAAAPTISIAQNAPRVFKVGMIGAGGRCVGAMAQIIEAAKSLGHDAKLVAVCDFFEDRAKNAAKKFGCDEKNAFWDANSYKQVVASDCEIIATDRACASSWRRPSWPRRRTSRW